MVGFNSTQRAHGDHVIHQPFSKLIDFYLSPSPVRRNRHANSMAKYRRNTPIPLIIKFLLFLPMRDLLGTSLLDPTSKQMPNGRVLSIYVHGTFSLSLFCSGLGFCFNLWRKRKRKRKRKIQTLVPFFTLEFVFVNLSAHHSYYKNISKIRFTLHIKVENPFLKKKKKKKSLESIIWGQPQFFFFFFLKTQLIVVEL
jgi:hypothetical protein